MDEKLFGVLTKYGELHPFTKDQKPIKLCDVDENIGKDKCFKECPFYMKAGVTITSYVIGRYTTHCFANLASDIIDRED